MMALELMLSGKLGSGRLLKLNKAITIAMKKHRLRIQQRISNFHGSERHRDDEPLCAVIEASLDFLGFPEGESSDCL